MAGCASELYLDISSDILKCPTGFSLDMGGSLLKIVYKDEAHSTEKVTRLGFISFPRQDLASAIDFLKAVRIERQSPEDIPLVYCTGVGIQGTGKEIEQEINVKIENLGEMECFVKSSWFCYKNVPENDFISNISPEACEKGKARGKKVINLLKSRLEKMKGDVPTSAPAFRPRVNMENIKSLPSTVEGILKGKPSCEPIGSQESAFPFILGMLGSGFVLLKIFEDGTYTTLGINAVGGRCFLSLASLLTGAKTYEEIIGLAKKGNERNLDIYIADSLREDGADDHYKRAGDLDLFIYAFGKATGKSIDDFSKEDLARAVLHMIAYNNVVQAVAAMTTNNISRYVLAGSFPSHQMTRDMMAENFINVVAFHTIWNDEKMNPVPPQLHFAKYGPYFGALGAFLHEKIC